MALADAVVTTLRAANTGAGLYAEGAIPAAEAGPTLTVFPMPETTNRIGVGRAMTVGGVQVTVRAESLRQTNELADRASDAVEGTQAATVTDAAILPGGLSLAGPGGGRTPALPEYDVTGRRTYAVHLRFVQQDTRPIN